MCMNSFSFRAELQSVNASETEPSETADLAGLHMVTKSQQYHSVQKLDIPPKKPLDFSALHQEWRNPYGTQAAPRFDIHLTVLIANHYRAFRTESQNLSAAGLFIKDLLPEDFSNHPFDVILIHDEPDGRRTFLLFRGRAVDGPLRSRRIRLETATPSSDAHLKKLIEEIHARIDPTNP